jgi:uncharacterized protein
MGAVPVRTCIGCRTKSPQADLLRVVARPDGTVWVDRPGTRAPGRGAYLCRKGSCVKRASLPSVLRRGLKKEVVWPQQLTAELLRRVQSGPEGRDEAGKERDG